MTPCSNNDVFALFQKTLRNIGISEKNRGALHKSLRGGCPDGALYYATRMLTAGEEPRYVTRRLIRFASEDIGLADPLALSQAVAADQAVHAIGMPEAGVIIAQCVICQYLLKISIDILFPRASERRVFQKEGGVNRSTYKRSSHM